jgi:O-antigen/teichoic acid export membrane protein
LKKVITDYFSVSSLQVVNYIFPLITLPYITRLFGPNNFGVINFAASIIFYLNLIVQYGFDLSATRSIAHNRENLSIVNEIFINVIVVKFFLFIVSTIIFFVLLLSVVQINTNFILFLFTYISLIANVIFPAWFLQGMEHLVELSIFNFFIKLIFTILVFIVLTDRSDFIYYPLILSVSQIFVAFISFVWVVRKFNLHFFYPSIKDIFKHLREGLTIFISALVTNVYTQVNIILIGFLSSQNDLGIFVAAQKIILIILAIIIYPLEKIFYPKIAHMFIYSPKEVMFTVKRLLLYVILTMSAVALSIYFFSGIIISVLYGSRYLEAIRILKLLTPCLVLSATNSVLTVQILLHIHKDKYYLFLTVFGALLSIVLNYYFISLFNITGAALTWAIVEFLICVITIYIIYKSGIRLFSI